MLRIAKTDPITGVTSYEMAAAEHPLYRMDSLSLALEKERLLPDGIDRCLLSLQLRNRAGEAIAEAREVKLALNEQVYLVQLDAKGQAQIELQATEVGVLKIDAIEPGGDALELVIEAAQSVEDSSPESLPSLAKSFLFEG